jgi:photosystem II stability/assembly factor-like uncharacterized protein
MLFVKLNNIITIGGSSMRVLYYNIAYLFMLMFIITSSAFSEEGFWQRCYGPYGGFVQDIIFRNDTMYCAGYGGLFRSINDGDSWEFLGIGNLRAREITQDKFYIYTGGYYGCYRYDTHSNIFLKVFDGTVQTITTIDSIIFIGTGYHPGIYRSNDFGMTWQASNSGIDNFDIEKLFVTKSKIILASASGASGSGIFRSTDLGISWNRIDPNPFAWNFHGICEFADILYAYDYSNYVKVYISEDDGASWQLPLGASAPADHIYAIRVDSSGLYVGTSDYGVFKSKNMGESWSQINSGLKNKDVFHISLNKDYHFATTFDGVYRKLANTKQWDYKVEGLTNTCINSIVSFNNKLFAGTHGAGLHYSTDQGVNWHRLNLFSGRNYIFDVYSTGQNIFVIASSNYLYPFGGKLYRSSNGGQTWIEKSNGFDTGLLECIAGNEDFSLVGSEYGLFKSFDQGNTWIKVLNGVPNNINVSDVAIYDSVAIVVNGTSGIFRTENFGEDWEYLQVPGLFSGQSIKAIGKEFYLGSGSVNEIFKSIDYGKTWNELNVPLSNSSVQDFAGDGKNIFASLSRDGGIIATSDSGKHWVRINQSLTVTDIKCLLYENDDLYAGSNGGGVFKYISPEKPVNMLLPLNNSTINQNSVIFKWKSFFGALGYRFQLAEDSTFLKIEIDNLSVTDTSYQVYNLDFKKKYFYRVSSVTAYWNNAFSEPHSFTVSPPPDFKLEQNYPNPFNSSTQIRYHLPKSTSIQIVLYDVMGKKIKTILNKTEGPGSFQITIDFSQLSNGVYYYQLKSENYTRTLKCVHIK